MSASVTFGSIGDIISLSIVIKDLVKALDESKGSSAEYQQIIRELWSLDKALLEVEMLWRTCETTVESFALKETANRMIKQCRQTIEAFLEKVKKYSLSLREGGSGSLIKDTAMKIKWQIAHANDLTKFRAEINSHFSAISMLLLTASVLGERNLHNRLSRHEKAIETSNHKYDVDFEEIKIQLIETNKQLTAGNALGVKILENLKFTWIRQMSEDIKNFMRKIYALHIATYNAVMDLRNRLPSHLERSLYQEPFILEDAVGRITPVHMQFISCWEAFDYVLETRFRNMQGLKMVQDKHYILQDHVTRREVNRLRSWEASILPGQKVNMSMLFRDHCMSSNFCPRCQMDSGRSLDMEVRCTGCNLWYQRIVESVDHEETQSAEATEQNISHPPTLNQTSQPQNASLGKRKREQFENENIALFNRVKILFSKGSFGDHIRATDRVNSVNVVEQDAKQTSEQLEVTLPAIPSLPGRIAIPIKGQIQRRVTGRQHGSCLPERRLPYATLSKKEYEALHNSKGNLRTRRGGETRNPSFRVPYLRNVGQQRAIRKTSYKDDFCS